MLRFLLLAVLATAWARPDIRPNDHFGGHFHEGAWDAKQHVLAFGDSLTEGFTDRGASFHPYAIKLQELFDANGFRVKVRERGISGETVVSNPAVAALPTMTSRLPAVLDEAKKHQVKIDWVVLMGGINDILRYGTSVDEVWGGHEDLYEACKERGVRVLVLTLLEVGPAIPAGGRVPELMQRRAWLNNMIRGAPREHSNVAVLDGGKAFPFPTNASDPRSPLWSDRIHLSSAGYDKLGALVYGALKQHLEK